MIRRIAALPLAILVLVFGVLGGVANAATTNLPTRFNANQHVYVDPALANTPGYAVNVSGLEQQIISASGNGPRRLNAYVVFLKQGDETVSGGFGAAKVEELTRIWSSSQDFPAKSYLIVTIVRAKSDPSKWSVGAKLGSGPSQFISSSQVSDAINQELSKLRGGDYNGFSVALVNNIMARLPAPTGQVVNNPPAKAPTSTGVETRPVRPVAKPVDQGSGGFGFLGIIAIVVVAGGGIWFFVNRSKLQSKVAHASKDWNRVLANANGCKDAIMQNYAGMLDGSWKFTPGSASEKSYNAAMAKWANFMAHLQAMKSRQKEIEAASPGTALELLTTRDITVRGDAFGGQNLPPEQVSLLTGFVKEEVFKPAQLIQALNDEFDEVNKALSELHGSISKARANAEAVKADAAAIEASRSQFEVVGLSFDPYKDRAQAIAGKLQSFQDKLGGDPLGAYNDSEATKAEVAALKSELEQALAMRQSAADVSAKIAGASQKVASQRAKTGEFRAVLNSPLGGDPRFTYTMAEEGHNPDTSIAEAEAKLVHMSALLQAGKLAEAAEAKAAALAAAHAAEATIEATIAAKKQVETEAPGLSSEFGDDSGFVAVARAYHSQNFMTAALAMAAFKRRRELRALERQMLDKHRTTSSGITAKATDRAVQRAQEALKAVESKFAVSGVNWTQLTSELAAIEETLNAAKAAVEADVSAHKAAEAAVGDFRKSYDVAEVAVRDDRVSELVRSKLKAQRADLDACERDLKGKKLDWKAISEKANAGKAACDNAKTEAEAEVERDEQFASELAASGQAIDEFGNKTYSRTIKGKTYGGLRCDTAEARRHQQAAEEYYRRRDYDRMQAELAAARQSTFNSDMLTWFLIMQMMHSSNDRYARDYAYQQGYRDGSSFDSWRDRQGSHSTGSSDNSWTSSWQPQAESDWRPSREGGGIVDTPRSRDNDWSGGGSSGRRDDSASRDNDWSGGSSNRDNSGSRDNDWGTGGGSSPVSDPSPAPSCSTSTSSSCSSGSSSGGGGDF